MTELQKRIAQEREEIAARIARFRLPQPDCGFVVPYVMVNDDQYSGRYLVPVRSRLFPDSFSETI